MIRSLTLFKTGVCIFAILSSLVFSMGISFAFPQLELGVNVVSPSKSILSGTDMSIGLSEEIIPGLSGEILVGKASRDFNQSSEIQFADGLESNKIGVGLKANLLGSDTGSMFIAFNVSKLTNKLKNDAYSYVRGSSTYDYSFSTDNSIEYMISAGTSTKYDEVDLDMGIGYSMTMIPVNVSKTVSTISGSNTLLSIDNYEDMLVDNKIVTVFRLKY